MKTASLSFPVGREVALSATTEKPVRRAVHATASPNLRVQNLQPRKNAIRIPGGAVIMCQLRVL